MDWVACCFVRTSGLVWNSCISKCIIIICSCGINKCVWYLLYIILDVILAEFCRETITRSSDVKDDSWCAFFTYCSLTLMTVKLVIVPTCDALSVGNQRPVEASTSRLVVLDWGMCITLPEEKQLGLGSVVSVWLSQWMMWIALQIQHERNIDLEWIYSYIYSSKLM